MTAVKTQVRWSPSELELLHGNKLASIEELTKLLPKHTAQAISIKRRREGLSRTPEERSAHGRKARRAVLEDNLCKIDQKLLFSDLSVVTQQLLWGSLLGDGCVRIGTGRKGQVSRNYHFYEGHSCAQRAYCDWKRRLLKEFHTTALSPHKRGVEFSTCSSPIFTRLRQEFYGRESHKHIIPADVKRGLNLFGLLIWYLDDGTMGYHSMDKLQRAGKTPSFSIATHSWRLEDLLEFCTDFNARFSTQLYCKTYKWKDTTTRIIKINKLSRDFLLPEWVKIKKDYSIPADIDYKLLIGK